MTTTLIDPMAWLRDGAPTTSLYPWEERLAFHVGGGRHDENLGKGDRMSYDAARLMDDNLLASIHAAVVEIGVCRLIGAYCFAAVWPKADHHLYSDELPDGLLGRTEIEIKWRRSADSMPVDLKDVERQRLVLWAESRLATRYGCVCSSLCRDDRRRSHSAVRLLGGGYAHELWDKGTTYNGDERRRRVNAALLQPFYDIQL
jgi:hypothetical protein